MRRVAELGSPDSGIGPYTGDFSDPPTQQEMRDYRGYQVQLRQAIVR